MASYVERGGDLAVRGPFLHEDVNLRVFAFEASKARLEALADAAFLRTAGLAYEPLGLALLAFAQIGRVRSTDPQDRHLGWSTEIDVAFWIPMRDAAGRVVFYIPYIFVDNPYAMASGREGWGFPKTIGRFEIPADPSSPAAHTVDTMALASFHEGTQARWHRVLTLARTARSGPLDRASAAVASLELGRLMPDGMRPRVPIVFLRQLRDVGDPARASYQEVLEATARTEAVRAFGPITGGHALRVEELASHPIAEQLGLAREQPALFAFWVDFDFTMELGRSLWSTRERPRAPRRKIAVLGGGMGALTAALALTDREEDREHLEVTVYQIGHRLGGKGASGRNLARSARIEEHGLHVWFGFYDNAFRWMRRCYDELGRRPGTPMARMEDAFLPHDLVVLQDFVDGQWTAWEWKFPRNHRTPGDGSPEPTLMEQLSRLLDYAANLLRLAAGAPVLEGSGATGRLWLLALSAGLGLIDRAAHGVVDSLPLLRSARALLGERLGGRLARDPLLHRTWMAADFALTHAIGILADDLAQKGFRAIDGEDYVEWLRRHRASERTLASPFVRAIYDLAFAYEGGDVSRPNFAASVAVPGVLELVGGYKGAFMWKMQAGMGDVVFAPMFEVLRRRGVKFEFFHEVRALRLGADRRTVDHVDIDVQASVRGEYRPLVDVNGLPCWPSEPDLSQLEDGEALRGHDLESPRPRSTRSGAPEPRTLSLSRGRDFDDVILGIPVGALPGVCGELCDADPAWRAMMDHVQTVRTMAVQLWLTPSLRSLGWPGSPDPIQGAFVEPIDTWADMTHLLSAERWPPGAAPGHLAYFCGPFPDAVPEEEARAELTRMVHAFLRNDAGRLWPRAMNEGTFRYEWLVDPDGRSGPLRLESQYLRVNVAPSERYVLSVKGSMQYRLRPEESGFTNLFLAGDWTDCVINAGCVEAAVISGLRCAGGVLGRTFPITGGWQSTPGPAPAARARPAKGPESR